MPNNCWINSDFSVSKHQVCADTMSQVSLFVDHIPFFCNSVFADGGLVTSCVTLLLKTFVNCFLHWRKPVFICRNAVGSGCSNSSETLSHYQKRPGSLQRAGEQAGAAQERLLMLNEDILCALVHFGERCGAAWNRATPNYHQHVRDAAFISFLSDVIILSTAVKWFNDCQFCTCNGGVALFSL